MPSAAISSAPSWLPAGLAVALSMKSALTPLEFSDQSLR